VKPEPGHSSLPLVTIVTPSFNQGEFIADAIESVLAQDYPAIEYLVMDGDSTDSTLDVLRSYGGRVRWTSERDRGQTDAIRKGFLAGTGKYLAWLNSDDRYVPGAIGAAVAELEANPSAALVYGLGEFIDRAGKLVGPCDHIEPWNFERLLASTNFLLQPATLFRREAYMAIGGLDPGLRYVMDYDLWIRLGARYPVRFLPRVLAQARVYPETKTNTGGLPRLEEMEKMVVRNGGHGLPREFRAQMWRELRPAYVNAFASHDYRLAARLGTRILRYTARARLGRLKRAIKGASPAE
jgi:glycosyltransferase involved in cell wall biosynthesis